MSKVVWIWLGFEPFLAPFWDLEAFFSEEGKKMPKVVWIWSGFEPFLGSFWDLEAFFRRKEKKCQKWFGFGLDLNPFWLHFETWRHFFRSRFSMFFWRCLFQSVGDFWAPMVAKRLPKWSPKGASGYLLGSEKTMVFTARKAYEGVSGRLWEAIFSRLHLQTLSGGVPGSILADFGRF